jgi:hypothetical protein
MTDQHNGPPVDDLELFAELIDASSLGGAEARGAIDRISVGEAMDVRDRLHPERPARSWRGVPVCTVAAQVLGAVMPDRDGAVDIVEFDVPSYGRLFAVNHRNEVHELDRDALIRDTVVLPGRGERTLWRVFLVRVDQYRCELELQLPAANDARSSPYRVLHIGLLWRVGDPVALLARGGCDLVTDIAPQIRFAAQSALGGAGTMSSLVGKLRLRAAVERVCRGYGLSVEAAVQIRSVLEVSVPAQVGRLVALMQVVRVQHNDAISVRIDTELRLAPAGANRPGDDQVASCHGAVQALVQSLRVSGLHEEEAMQVAVEAFRELLQDPTWVWGEDLPERLAAGVLDLLRPVDLVTVARAQPEPGGTAPGPPEEPGWLAWHGSRGSPDDITGYLPHQLHRIQRLLDDPRQIEPGRLGFADGSFPA